MGTLITIASLKRKDNFPNKTFLHNGSFGKRTIQKKQKYSFPQQILLKEKIRTEFELAPCVYLVMCQTLKTEIPI